MKTCLSCHKTLINPDWLCSKCGYQPKSYQGILQLIVEKEITYDGFDAKYFPELAKLEENNFWFLARNQLIIWALKKYFSKARNFLEVGCGTGFVLSGIARSLPTLEIHGSEFFRQGLDFAAKRLPSAANLFHMDARNIPFVDEFDAIGAFDVVEHISQDIEVLKQMYQAVRAGGSILLTVPIHPWLWSAQDEYAHHVRRYTIKELKQKVEQAGFTVARKTAFVSFLLPVMFMSRFRKKKLESSVDYLAELKLNKALDYLLRFIMFLERILIRLGVNFPAGGSMILVAKKK